MEITDDIDALVYQNTGGEVSGQDVQDAFHVITESEDSPIAKAAIGLTGFDRDRDRRDGTKQVGILQFCLSASSGEVHQIGSDTSGTYTLLTGQTTFADGTALADRTLMQYHDTGETTFSYWYEGEHVVETGAKFIQVADDFDGYITYDSSGDLDDTITDVPTLMKDDVLVAYLYLNENRATVEWFADERHGLAESGQTHMMTHQSSGFFVSRGHGFDFTGIANNGETFTSLSGGQCGDEDIKMVIAVRSTIPKLYREGASGGRWCVSDDDNKLGIFRSAKCCYNLDTAGTWTLQEIDSKYIGMVPLVTNNKIHPVVILVGQTLYANRGAARDNAYAEFFRIDASGLPGQEIQEIASWILHVESDGEIEIGADGERYTVLKCNYPYGIFNDN